MVNLRRWQLRTLVPTALLLITTTGAVASAPALQAVSPGQTQVLSVPENGDPAAAEPAGSPAISGNGRYVAFDSRAALDPVVTPHFGSPANVYVRDRQAPGHTVLISRGLPMSSATVYRGDAAPVRRTATPEQGGNRDSRRPSISADGRYVAFDSEATNLRDSFPGYGSRVVVCDRDPDGDGDFDELRPDGTMDYSFVHLASPSIDGQAPTGTDPSISADGSTVAWKQVIVYWARAEVVVAELRKDATGRLLPPDAELFRRPSEAVPGADGTDDPPKVSADGHHVVFSVRVCATECCVTCTPGGQYGPSSAIQVFELATGRLDRVDDPAHHGFWGRAGRPVISETGRMIAFEQVVGEGPVLAMTVDRDPDGNGKLGPAGGAPVVRSVASRDVNGQPREGRAPVLSADGRYVAFESSADGMHSDVQGTGRTAVVLRDLTIDISRAKAGLPRLPGELGSPSTRTDCTKTPDSPPPFRTAVAPSCPAAGPSRAPQLSADGSVVTFVSAGDDVLPDCCPGAVFARAFQPVLRGDPASFGTVAIGNSAFRTVVLRHAGFGPLRIVAVRLIGPHGSDFTLSGAESCAGAILHQTGSCLIGATFRPEATGGREATLRIELPDGGVVETPLTAVGSEAPATPPPPSTPPTPPAPPTPPVAEPPAVSGGLVVTPDPLVFDGPKPALVVSGPRTVLVRNAATAPITVTRAAILEGPRFRPGEFAVARSTCGARTLAPAETCAIEVSAKPQEPGRRDGVLAIETTDPADRRLVALRSTAAQPVLLLNPAVVRRNRVTTVIGRDFPPGRSVSVTLGTPGSRTLLTVTTKADGTFTAPLLVFPQSSAGTWPVIATLAVAGARMTAQAPLLVVPGSYQPPGFTSRR